MFKPGTVPAQLAKQNASEASPTLKARDIGRHNGSGSIFWETI